MATHDSNVSGMLNVAEENRGNGENVARSSLGRKEDPRRNGFVSDGSRFLDNGPPACNFLHVIRRALPVLVSETQLHFTNSSVPLLRTSRNHIHASRLIVKLCVVRAQGHWNVS